jgi:hypothetical protein
MFEDHDALVKFLLPAVLVGQQACQTAQQQQLSFLLSRIRDSRLVVQFMS